jgi:hypothetical protein
VRPTETERDGWRSRRIAAKYLTRRIGENMKGNTSPTATPWASVAGETNCALAFRQLGATMPLSAYKGSTVFEPETANAMGRAFNEICEALKLTPTQEAERRRVASKVIQLAQAGVTDPMELRDRILPEVRSPEL